MDGSTSLQAPVQTPIGRLRHGWPEHYLPADDVLIVRELRHVDLVAVRRCGRSAPPGGHREDTVARSDLEVVAGISIPTDRFLRHVGAAVDAIRRRSIEPGRRRDDPCWCGSGERYAGCHG